MIANGFIRDSFNAMIGALECAAERAGLITRHAPVTRAAARRFMSRLRQLETLLRRLLVLMAAELELDMQPLTPAKAGVSSSKPAPSNTTRAHPERSRRTGTRTPGFPLLRILRPYTAEDAARLSALPRRAPRPADETLLVHRYCTLLKHLQHPERLARRMARHLARLRTGGEIRPTCAPQPGLHRLSAELGALAACLPALIAAALSDWYDTG
ncbi:hypothetical protein [Henriciella algicola]|uniref:Uncharacterized protein n=1 Tax=Henriciella algicola TaxID=1608422 RepID=A0A399RGY0_9PROT|nr:hypothetical protein [Henriciella algicola]RIJ30856.1 hypothetical protein D1222_00870 [Henriciella algicola]